MKQFVTWLLKNTIEPDYVSVQEGYDVWYILQHSEIPEEGGLNDEQLDEVWDLINTATVTMEVSWPDD